MLISKSRIHIVDNTGGSLVNCITTHNSRRWSSMGSIVTVSLRKLVKNKNTFSKKVHVGKVYRAIIIQTKKEMRRYDGSTLQFSQNAAVLLDHKNQPIGTRIKTLVPRELRSVESLKAFSLGTNLI